MKKTKINFAILLILLFLIFPLSFVHAQEGKEEEKKAEELKIPYGTIFKTKLQIAKEASMKACKAGEKYIHSIFGTKCPDKEGTLVFVLIIAVWLGIFLVMGDILSNATAFSGFVSYSIAFGLAVIFTQFGIIAAIVKFFFETTFGKIILVIILVGIFVAYVLLRESLAAMKKAAKKAKEEERKKKAEAVEEAFIRIGKELEKQ